MQTRTKWYVSKVCEGCGDLFRARNIFYKKHGKPQSGAMLPHRNSNGYMYEFAPDHPSVQGKNYRRVLQHRLVMERSIGRYLVPGESVHHKNGVKEDNRIENLELWFRPQAAGQRVTDLIEYIVRMHRPLVLTALEKQLTP